MPVGSRDTLKIIKGLVDYHKNWEGGSLIKLSERWEMHFVSYVAKRIAVRPLIQGSCLVRMRLSQSKA